MHDVRDVGMVAVEVGAHLWASWRRAAKVGDPRGVGSRV